LSNSASFISATASDRARSAASRSPA